jgi:hypothetical protein
MRNYFGDLWRERGGAITIGGVLLFIIIMLSILLLSNQPNQPTPTPTPAPTSTAAPSPTATALSSPTATPTPRPTPTVPARTVALNPQHGIHAPIGRQWTDPLRQVLGDFRDANGQTGAPGSVLALSTDMLADNNTPKIRMEEDLYYYQRQGAEIYIRMYPQRLPGGFTEPVLITDSRNTISGTPEDAAEDIFRFVDAQHKRNGWHFTRIVPGNEPDLEWANGTYFQNVLLWQSYDDPAKYRVINQFWIDIYRAWERRVAQPDAVRYRDVQLYFPPLAQDAAPDENHAAFNFYEYANGVLRPAANRYDYLREGITLYGRIVWHNYFRPGKACDDVAAGFFPDWLKTGIAGGWDAVIGEAGWSPDKFTAPASRDGRAAILRVWRLVGVKWERKLYEDDRPQFFTADATLDGARFEDDLAGFAGGCAFKGLNLPPTRKIGIAVWLAGSEGNFLPALGVEPGETGTIRRWLKQFADLRL